MNLLADEGVDKSIVDKLRQDGHEVAYIAEMSPGIDDDTILRQANDNGALPLRLTKILANWSFVRDWSMQVSS